jgi:TM2 domain-containing membrane protein YozV
LALCVALGVLGAHRLYAGRIATGIFFFTGGGLVIWWLVDIFQIIGGRFSDIDGNRFDRW